MKLEIYTTPQWANARYIAVCSRHDESEKVVRLALRPTGNGGVALMTVCADGGHLWCLLRIRPDGTFYRPLNINNSSGFQLDDKGRVEIADK